MFTPLIQYVHLLLNLHQAISNGKDNNNDNDNNEEINNIRDDMHAISYDTLLEKEFKITNELSALLNEERDRMYDNVRDNRVWRTWENLNKDKDIFSTAGETLREMSLSTGSSSTNIERLQETNFKENNSYKASYRFLSNMTTQWGKLGLEHFPTEDEAILIATKASPYFIWLFKDEDELTGYKNIYWFMEDIWNDNKET